MSQDGRLIGHFCGLHIVYGGVSVQTWLQSGLVFVFIYEGHRVAWPEVGALWCVCVGQKDIWSSREGQTSSRLSGAASLLSITRTQSRSRVSSSKGGTVVQVRDGGGLHWGEGCGADEKWLISWCTYGHSPHSNHTELTSSLEEHQLLVPPAPSWNTLSQPPSPPPLVQPKSFSLTYSCLSCSNVTSARKSTPTLPSHVSLAVLPLCFHNISLYYYRLLICIPY